MTDKQEQDTTTAAQMNVNPFDTVEALKEWRQSIINVCKGCGSDNLPWGGDKSGWGFIYYFIQHLHTRATLAEAALAATSTAKGETTFKFNDDGTFELNDSPTDAPKKVLVKYAFCCPGSVLYCDCVNKNHGTAVMGENEAGDDYPIVGPAPEVNPAE